MKVIITCDRLFIRHNIEKALLGKYSYKHASSAKELLDIAKECTSICLVIDMDIEHSYESVQKLKEINLLSHIPVLAILKLKDQPSDINFLRSLDETILFVPQLFNKIEFVELIRKAIQYKNLPAAGNQ